MREIINDLLLHSKYLKQKEYWTNKLSMGFTGNRLLSHYKRGQEDQKNIKKIELLIIGELYDKLVNLGNHSNLSIYIILLTALNILIYKYSNQDDIVIVSPVYKQIISEETLNDRVFICNEIKGDMPLIKLLLKIRQVVIEAYQNQDYPYDKLLESLFYLTPDSISKSDSDIFNIVCLLKNIHNDSDIVHDMKDKIVFSFKIKEQQIKGHILYDSDIYRDIYLNKIAVGFKKILEKLVEDINIKASAITLNTDEEKKQLIYQFNHTESEFPKNRTLHQLFQEQMEKIPDHISLSGLHGISHLSKSRSHVSIQINAFVTYRVLNEKSGELADIFRTNGVIPDTIVAIMMERSFEMIISIMAVLKSGAAYLPINIKHPDERIRFILADSSARILITHKRLQLIKPDLQMLNVLQNIILFEDLIEKRVEIKRKEICSKPAENIYSIYTSGTTGKPKGVLVKHSSVVNYCCWAAKTYVRNRRLDFPLYTSIAFDLTVTSLFVPLITGSTIVLYGDEASDVLIEQVIKDNLVGVVKLTPSHLKLINDKELGQKNFCVKCFIIGGEALETRLAKEIHENFKGNIEIYNEYGPTETTVGSMIYKFDSHLDTGKMVPIGTPIGNTQIYILDENLELAPIGATGEIYISGDGIAAGYLCRPELTSAHFALNPYIPGKRMYRTGDIAQRLPDGSIDFLGRNDHQVKVRGFRIELGEIERVLVKHKEIKDALVINREIRDESTLCAYIVPVKDIDIYILREYLLKELPEYMHPVYFVKMDQIPLTANGKMNLRGLPEPEISRIGEYEAPVTLLEKNLQEVWSEVLGVEKDKISINDKFLELGGHSLKAITLTSEIYKKLNIKIPLHKIFDLNTIKALAGYIREATKDVYIQINAVEKREYYFMSLTQRRMYILHSIDLESTAYNVSHGVILEGNLQRDRIKEVFVKLIKRHEALRTSFELVNGEIVQRINQEVEFKLEYLYTQFFEMKPDSQDENSYSNIIENYIKPFNLSHAPLLRLGLMVIGVNRHILLLDMPHIISDGISMGVIAADLMTLYADKELPIIRIQYKDYTQWQYKFYVKSQAMKRQEQFWLEQFNDELPLLNLPADYTRMALKKIDGDILTFTLDKQETEQLNSLALRENVSLFMLLLALYYVLLAKVSDQEDIIIGVNIGGRTHSDCSNIIGLFANTLALRNFPQKNKTFKQFLGQLKKKTIRAFENQEYSFDTIIEKLKIKRSINRNPLFDVVFQMSNFETKLIEIPGLNLRPISFKSNIPKHDLILSASEYNNELYFSLEYNSKLFKRETIERFVVYFKEIISAVLADPGNVLSKIQEIPKEKKQKKLSELKKCLSNELNLIKQKNSTLQDNLLKSLNSFNHKTAIQYGSRAFSYQYLDKKSNYIANWLLSRRVKKETSIGVLIDDRIQLIVTMLGIFKAGCIFVPLDPSFPRNRLDLMIRITGIKLVFIDESEVFGCKEIEKLVIDYRYKEQLIEFIPLGYEFFNMKEEWFERKPKVVYDSEDKIYVYFTSGTTGIPGAIIGKNIALNHFIEWEIDTFGIDDTSRISQLTTPGFDAFLRDILVPLYTGGTICIPPSRSDMLNSDELITWLELFKVNLIHCVPGIFRLIGNGSLKCGIFKALKFILLSGEKINPTDLKDWYKRFGSSVQLVNLWGTSETTLAKTCYFIQPEDINRERIPVGKPIPGASLSIWDSNMNWNDQLMTGDIYIHTPYQTFGYCNMPELTNKKFIQNPLNNDSVDIMHATGDKGRILSDGNLDLLGRNDRQEKIRGIRIEPSEIENVLVRHPMVKEAAVIKLEDLTGNEWLCAYITVHLLVELEDSFLNSNLKKYLSDRLPAFMIPSRIMKLDKMPRTPNGKLDYKGFPDPLETDRDKNSKPLPGDEIEYKLLNLWGEILKKECIGITDHFYELGGNSLNVMSLISKIHKAFDVRIPLAEIFKNPTIQKQAEIIRKSGEEKHVSIKSLEKKEYYPVSYAQRRVWALSQLNSASLAFNLPMAKVLKGELNRWAFKKVFIMLIERHESLRTIFIALDGDIYQRVLSLEEINFTLTEIDLRKIGQDERKQKAMDLYISESNSLFDLSKGPLIRATLVHMEEKKYIFMLTLHHIVSDYLSGILLASEIFALYNTFEKENHNPLKLLRIHYKEFANWQNNQLRGDFLKKHQNYWLNRFRKGIPQLNLPLDNKRPKFQTYNGDSSGFLIEESLTRELRFLSDSYDITLFMTFLAAVNVLLYYYSSQNDIIIGIPIAGRQHAELDDQVGFYLNTLALRTIFKEEELFSELIKNVKRVALGAFEHQAYPFDKLVEDLKVKRDIQRHPLFDIVIDMQNYIQPKHHSIPTLSGMEISSYLTGLKSSKFDLTLYIYEDKHKIYINFEYNTDIFRQGTILYMIERFKRLLGSIVKNPDTRLCDFQLEDDLEMPPIAFLHQHPRQSVGNENEDEFKIKSSYHQERLWFIDQFESRNVYHSSPIYHNIPLILEIDGSIDIGILEKSFRSLIKRHEVLRTRMIADSNEPSQWIHPVDHFKLEIFNLKDYENRDKESSTDSVNFCLEKVKSPFEMDKDPFIRAYLISLTENRFILAIAIHHIISDRFSLTLIFRELMEYYQGYMRGTELHLPEPLLQYRDFSQWQHEFPVKVMDSLLFYWRRQLKGQQEPLALPTDRPREFIHRFEDGIETFEFPASLSGKIKSFSLKKGVNNFIVLLAVLKVLFYRYTGQEEIILGTSVKNRVQPGTENIIGPIANLLPLRSHLKYTDSFDTILVKVKKVVNDALKYQEIPFDRLVRELNLNKDMSRIALFDVLFQYEENSIKTYSVENLSARFIETNLGWGKYDLNLLVQEEKNAFSGILVYNKLYFNPSTIIRLIHHYFILIEGLLVDSFQPIFKASLLTREERNQLLMSWNQTQSNYPGHKLLHQIFSEQVKNAPDHVALVGEEGKIMSSLSISYKELNTRSARLSYTLMDKGIQPDTIVAIMMERSVKLIIGILGILKAGGAYLPLDPQYPQERINFMLKDSGTDILITSSQITNKNKIQEEFQDNNINVIFVDEIDFSSSHSHSLTFSLSHSNNLAYIIYTSGTTGKPKGCGITHKNVVRLMINDDFQFDFGAYDVWIMYHSFCFDFSIWEIFGALLYGGRLIIPSLESIRDYGIFIDLLKTQNVTVLNQTPLSFYNLVEEEKKIAVKTLDQHLRYVIFGGDQLSPSHLKDWVKRYPLKIIRLVNMFGITETTVHATHHLIKEADIHSSHQSSPIGCAIPETSIYIFDYLLNLVPIGVVGEIFVGGSGVCRGYLNRVILTSRCFIENPFQEGEILYRSGDLGKWQPDGNIQYIGRNDDQVKIRGYRIELGEIQHQLLNHIHINEAVVISVQESTSAGANFDTMNHSLCAYFVSDIPLSITGLRKYLSENLPDYMIPHYLMPMDKIPLTFNGKVDRNALAKPILKPEGVFEPPRNRIEEVLVGVWSEVLNLEINSITIDANFFEIGGHSLKATTMVAKIHKELNIKLPLSQVFMKPVLKELAEYIKSLEVNEYEALRPVPKKDYYVLSSGQKRLYIVHQLNNESIVHNMTNVVRLEGDLEIEYLEKVFIELIKRHEVLRTSFFIKDGEPMQKINENVNFNIQTHIVSPNITCPVEDLIQAFIKPFDLSQAPLIRVGLIKSEELQNKQILMIDIHHIISDGTSHDVLVQDFLRLLKKENSPPLKLQYKDFSEWQHKLLISNGIKNQEKYWLNKFKGNVPELSMNLLTDYPRPSVLDRKGDRISFEINEELTEKINKLAKATGSTVYIVLMAVYNVLLSKYTGQDDIIVGTSIAGRDHADLGKIIGLFVNMLAIRSQPSEEKLFRDFLIEVKKKAFEAYENQGYPFDELVKLLGIDRILGRHPIFDTQFTFQNHMLETANKSELMVPDIEIKPYHFAQVDWQSEFDLSLTGFQAGDKIMMEFYYLKALFNPLTIQGMVNNYIEILDLVLKNENIKITDILISHELLSGKSEYFQDEFTDFSFKRN